MSRSFLGPQGRRASRMIVMGLACAVLGGAAQAEEPVPPAAPPAESANQTAADPASFEQVGAASFYADRFQGRRTANGETYDADELTAAHPDLPFGSVLEVTNLDNGKTVKVRVNDRGPYHGRRVIDLSRAAAETLDFMRRGTAKVRIRAFLPGSTRAMTLTPDAGAAPAQPTPPFLPSSGRR
ncbi:septal ring lytic transglycosylase RlpA family protein [Caulobacter sp. 17J80-11]|nr:septal ring lytic transglycosylase RlpA family protein [Caulobacter sp. 17J80-11]